MDKITHSIGYVNLHIENGGVSIGILDGEYGPELVIDATHFGHTTNGIKLLLHPDALKDLAKLFAKAASHNFENEPYCIALGQHRKACCQGSCGCNDNSETSEEK